VSERPLISDAAQRAAALDPARSCIVQAPAGSGKTGLLIQRFLTLLATVEAPEEILAITFTRKAAGEMRERVLEALRAAPGEEPAAEHDARTWRLARAALARERELGWELRANPARLRIQTIDSLCNALARQMPVLSRFGAPPATLEDSDTLYREAARATLALLESDARFGPDVERLLLHLDNRVAVAEELLVTMLRRRDHWLRHLPSPDAPLPREALERALANLRADFMARAAELAPAAQAGALAQAARFAAAHLPGGSVSPIRACLGLRALPGAGELEPWLGLAELLLTREGNWRRKLDVRQGFPAQSSARDRAGRDILKSAKEGAEALLDGLAPEEAFRAALARLRLLPGAEYTEAQWEALGAFARLLPVAAAQLKLVFQARGRADFTEVAQAAVQALGSDDAPTDLALALDYRVRHLLVDEFQDTSLSQFELLRRLTAGWQPGDGRTLFCVGDPMQSIYRFREAEVALFLQAWHRGIGGVALEPLRLATNFRSAAGIVEWVNAAFPRVMPAREDMAAGAVPYAPFAPAHPAGEGQAVSVHALFDEDREAEAARVVQLVQEARAADPGQTVAILVRSRAHLSAIAPALRRAGLAVRAIEIEKLGARPAVQDLLSLARALSHPADRLAWLALLRAPWCGLTLADLEALAGGDERTVWELMQDPGRVAGLSADGRGRLQRVREVLGAALDDRRRGLLRDQVEGTWLALGGPAGVDDETGLDDAAVFLDYLEEMEAGGDIADPGALQEGLDALFARPDVHAGEQLQVMTIHKAKGLEFDTVIVPGLGYPPRREDPQLLKWMERPRPDGKADLVLAPVKERGAEDDPIYRLLAALDAEKDGHEQARLLYVAATRARRRLHLLGRVAAGTGETGWEIKPPAPRSLLEKLWPAVEREFGRAAAALPPPGAAEAPPPRPGPGFAASQLLRRLPSGWSPPAPPPAVAWAAPREERREGVEFSWAQDTARLVGIVVHRWLRALGEAALAGWDRARVEGLRPALAGELSALGVPGEELEAAAGRAAEALLGTLEDGRGRWLLGPRAGARCEWRLTGVLDGEIVDAVLDRSFVDEEGARWIVDYKTGSHEGGDVDAFLDRERERYAPQLEKYARLVGALEPRPLRLGLYFPLLGGWREW
jgi:ATP-dependent exoDNAse (exonuclease V) beta subunit